MSGPVRGSVGVVLATAALFGGAAAQAAERIMPPISNPCAAGDALLRANRLDDARGFYTAQLNQRPGLTCAEFGLAAAAGEESHAQRKLEQGDDALGQATRLRTQAADARDAAERLEGKVKETKLDEARGLDQEAAAQEAIAKAAYTDALAHDVDLPTATAALEMLPPDPKKNWAERWGDWVQKNFLDRADDVGRMLAFGAAGLLALAVAAIGLLRLLARVKPVGRRLARRRWLRRVVHRPLVIGAIDGDEAGVLWQIRDALGTASAPIGGGVDLATGTDNSDQVLEGVGGALAKLPQGVLLAGAWRFVRLLVARTPLTVEGKTLPHGRRGVGLSLSVARGRRLLRTVTLWQQSYELGPVPAEEEAEPPWERLAIGGAAWAQYTWLERLGGRELTRSLGTADWQSFAFLQVGLEVTTRDADRDLAQALFAQAVARDPANLQALFNLAVVDRRGQEPEQAIERLLGLERAVAKEATPPGVEPNEANRPNREILERDSLWFQATYNLAAAYVQRYIAVYRPGDDPVDQPDFAKALQRARLLVRDVEVALRWYARASSLTPTQRACRSAVEAVEGPGVALLASLHAMRLRGRDIGVEPVGRTLQRWEVVKGAEAREFPPHLLVEGFLVKDARRASHRARYNLACYYSRLAAMPGRRDGHLLLERALSELAYGVETGELVDLAIDDPGLRELRERKAPEFWETLGRERPPEGTAVLGRVRAIGPSFAAKLAKEGVTSPSELLDRAGTEGDAKVLASSVRARQELVVRWGRLARLMTTVDSLGIDGANLLDEARVDSVKRLAGSDAYALTRLVASVNEAFSIVATAPTKHQVAHWIEDAKARAPR